MKKAKVYWEVAAVEGPVTKGFGQGAKQKLVEFEKDLQNGLADILLSFDNVANAYDTKSTNLAIDTIAVNVGAEIDGKLVIASGKLNSSVTVTLKRK